MASQTQALINQITQFRNNPMAIQRTQLSALQDVLAGNTDVVDASNPFIFLMEMGSVLGAAGMTASEVDTRKQYASMALSLSDLYLHMSDKDYVGNFANPGLTRLFILLNKDEVYAKAVPTGVGSISQLTIPRETYFKIGQYVFTMQYPININIMGHGSLQITYDESSQSPLQNLASNLVTTSFINISGQEYLKLELPIYQFQISTSYGSVNQATGFSMTYAYPNQYYYARVYVANLQTKKWQELTTTYTDQVFDPVDPTAVLTVLDGNKLQVDIPQIYLTTGQISTEIRVDIFSTLGSLDLVLSDYQLSSWQTTFIDLDSSTDRTYISPYVAPLSTMIVTVGSDSTVTGGTDAISFDDLRTRVINNATGAVSLPITIAQVGTTLNDLGYDVVLDVDDVTNRIFLATRQLPAPSDNSVSSGAGCAIMTLQDSMNHLVGFDTVSDNGNRITLQPKTLYQVSNGILSAVSDTTVASLLAMPQQALIAAINSGNYVYTPFHYVLDINSNAFQSRAYYLDAPSVAVKSFITQNDTLGMTVGAALYQITRTHVSDGGGAVDGYLIKVVTQSDSVFEALSDSQIHPQLSYVPTGEVTVAYVNGTLISHCNPDGTTNTSGVERAYQFVLETNYDLDNLDNLCITNAAMFDNGPGPTFTSLSTVFNLIWAVSGVSVPGQTSSAIDLLLNTTNLPTGTVGLTQEQLTMQLGYAMSTLGLWTRSRSVVASTDYARYTAPVPLLYTSNIYARSPDGNILITNNSGVLSFTVEHSAGDPVLDPTTGLPMIKYEIGDVILDGSGNPVVVTTRNMARQVDMLMIDGVYWFATSPSAIEYSADIPQLVYGWLTNDIATVSQNLLEQTQLFLYPKSTMGPVTGTVIAGTKVTVEARLSFTVDYYLSGANYRNTDLRASLTTLAGTTLAAAVQQSTIATNQISETLTDAAGTDVIALDISGLGGNGQNFTTFSAIDGSVQLSIGKVAFPAPDGTIGVQDAISVNFVQHTTN